MIELPTWWPLAAMALRTLSSKKKGGAEVRVRISVRDRRAARGRMKRAARPAVAEKKKTAVPEGKTVKGKIVREPSEP